MENLKKLLLELRERPLQISDTAKGEVIQQTQRNKLKADLLQAISMDIKTALSQDESGDVQETAKYIFQSTEGLLIEIANNSIADNLKNGLGSGAITACLDIKIKALDCNAESESASFMEKLLADEEKRKHNAEMKRQKVERDTKDRAKRQAEKLN